MSEEHTVPLTDEECTDLRRHRVPVQRHEAKGVPRPSCRPPPRVRGVGAKG